MIYWLVVFPTLHIATVPILLLSRAAYLALRGFGRMKLICNNLIWNLVKFSFYQFDSEHLEKNYIRLLLTTYL